MSTESPLISSSLASLAPWAALSLAMILVFLVSLVTLSYMQFIFSSIKFPSILFCRGSDLHG